MDMVMRMVSESGPVVIFSRTSCCISHSIKNLFYQLGVNPVVFELDEINKGREIEQSLLKRGRNPPAVFIGGDFVGGANKIMSLHLEQSLLPMLINAGALLQHPAAVD
ncbi:monothiol glutaredoxin-S2-like [Rutidosis leptorrhynchoides]|uniref:monothiol glutaredoxin-S2-like n=1 Tax=Rutidosis leptorrhynchoides TaxID=125765 RepID=UPI003A99CAA9